jgi:Tol biopolymer transport system component
MRGKNLFASIVIATSVLLAACGGDDASTGELIAFASDQDGDWDVYLLDPTARIARRVINNGATDLAPDLSHDGRRIVFASNYLDGKMRDYIDRSGESSRRIIGEVLGDSDIFSIDSDGQNLERLTSTAAIDEQPTWSPDGSQIAFQSDMSGDIEIHVMGADGGNLRQLTTSPGDDWSPTWSPDGERIAFASSRNGNWDIFTMNADGSRVEQITSDPGMDWLPAWSPSGETIAFASDRDGNWEIYVVDTDGSGSRNITDNQATDLEPVWSPDGDKLIFSSSRDGSQELFTVHLDGSDPERLGQSGLPFSWVRP